MKWEVPVLMAACLAACGGGDMTGSSTTGSSTTGSSTTGSSATNTPTAPPAARKDFTTFTEKLIGSQSDTGEPLAVASTDFYFPDDNNEAAFAAVMPAV